MIGVEDVAADVVVEQLLRIGIDVERALEIGLLRNSLPPP